MDRVTACQGQGSTTEACQALQGLTYQWDRMTGFSVGHEAHFSARSHRGTQPPSQWGLRGVSDAPTSVSLVFTVGKLGSPAASPELCCCSVRKRLEKGAQGSAVSRQRGTFWQLPRAVRVS